jgi:hypothetical protein
LLVVSDDDPPRDGATRSRLARTNERGKRHAIDHVEDDFDAAPEGLREGERLRGAIGPDPGGERAVGNPGAGTIVRSTSGGVDRRMDVPVHREQEVLVRGLGPWNRRRS